MLLAWAGHGALGVQLAVEQDCHDRLARPLLRPSSLGVHWRQPPSAENCPGVVHLESIHPSQTIYGASMAVSKDISRVSVKAKYLKLPKQAF